MIQEATGRTTGGAAINLDETTYDEVYGRIGIFKVGVGYRTTPRTEAVVNFVYVKSDAQDEATQIGTVGTSPQVPLTVNFTEYQYWGVEGGQRWFFARTRFTPFVGYLVGINRHQDIRGTFVGVPPISRRDLPRRTASSSKSRGRSAWVRPVACSSAWVPSR